MSLRATFSADDVRYPPSRLLRPVKGGEVLPVLCVKGVVQLRAFGFRFVLMRLVFDEATGDCRWVFVRSARDHGKHSRPGRRGLDIARDADGETCHIGLDLPPQG